MVTPQSIKNDKLKIKGVMYALMFCLHSVSKPMQL